ncbi:hypothetical protein CR513_27231, partial [Mucuna pruriens]
MEDSESIANYFDRIQELVNAMRACKEKVIDHQVVDKILRTLPPEFDYVAAAIEESKDLDTMEVEELQHFLEVHEMRVNKRKVLKEQAFQAQINYKGKGKGPWKGNKSSTNHKHQDQEFSETSESSKERRKDQTQKQGYSSKNSKEWNWDQELFQDSAVNLEGELIHSALITEVEPVEFEKVMTEEKWLKAMKDEINSIEKNQTWELVDPPSNKKLKALKWVYKVKVNPRGEVVKNKTRLVTKGFLHKAGIDYGEVYAPVAMIETIRLVVAITINAGWSMHQLDVKSAFLNGPLEEEVYVDQPLGFVVKGKENKVYKLKKALYGLKPAPRAWSKRIDDYLSQIDFKKCT